MKNVKIGDTYVSSREYERKTSNNSQQQARASEKEDDFEVNKKSAKGILCKIKRSNSYYI